MHQIIAQGRFKTSPCAFGVKIKKIHCKSCEAYLSLCSNCQFFLCFVASYFLSCSILYRLPCFHCFVSLISVEGSHSKNYNEAIMTIKTYSLYFIKSTTIIYRTPPTAFQTLIKYLFHLCTLSRKTSRFHLITNLKNKISVVSLRLSAHRR